MIGFFIIVTRFIRTLREGFREPEFRGLFIFVAILLASGTFAYTYLEKWSIIDSLYFCVTALTTVGSKLQPVTTFGKIFTIIYILFGLGSVAAFISAIATHSKDQHPGRNNKDK